ncbi:MAG: diguanylate cyclase [Marinobacterium sp.]|nr:diguanylate cyclase [Marinobacterium sp.]
MKVLIVEDSTLVTRILKRIISQQTIDMEVVLCTTMAQAQVQLELAPDSFFVALVDLNLPDAPNGEVVDLMLGRGLPTVVLTGSFDEQRRESLLQQGVVDYVVKESRYSYEFAVQLLARLYTNQQVKILLAEDSAAYRKLLRQQLKRYNYQVLEATDAEKALVQLREQPDIRILITDYHMPGMNGVELVQVIRREMDKNDLVIIALSSADSGALSAQFIKNGANDFLRKPFNYEELHCRVMQNLDTINLLNQVRRAAYEDVLTGLHNRRYLFEEAPTLLQRAQDSGRAVCLAMMDLDHFKQVNDNWGHDGGDRVLASIAELLSTHLKRFMVTRIGGEEFCLLLEGIDLDRAEQLLEHLRVLVEQSPVLFDGAEIPVTMSIGITEFHSESLSSLMSRADDLLYAAKEAGRNQVVSG